MDGGDFFDRSVTVLHLLHECLRRSPLKVAMVSESIMIGWVQASLYDAIDCLARSGKNHLASDLGRLLSSLDFDDLDVLRSPVSERVADALLEASTFPDLVDLLKEFAEAIGVIHCTLHVVRETPTSSFSTRALTTYPEDWVARYIDRRYFTCDPVYRGSLTCEAGFYWEDLDVSVPAVRAFCQDARAYGVGPSGYTLPIITERGDKIAISVSAADDREGLRDTIRHYEADLLTVGFSLTEAFSRLASDERPAAFNPTDDQLSVLRAVAMGADDAELRSRSYLYGSYATLERSICALFRTRTIAQAAVVAVRVGLLTNSPITKSDILVGSKRPPTFRVDAQSSPTAVRRMIRMRNVGPIEREEVPAGV